MTEFVFRDFSVPAGDYQRVMWRLFIGRHWPWMVLPVVLCGALAAALADVRWLIVGLMLTFMALPMVLVLIHINYALTLEVRWSLMTKTATIDEHGIHLAFDDVRMKPRTIAWSDISSVTRDKRAIYFNLRVRRYNFFMLPRQVVDEQTGDEAALVAFIKKQFAQQRHYERNYGRTMS